MEKLDMRGLLPETWACIDCGINTAPGCSNRKQAEQAFARNSADITQTFNEYSEVYTVKEAVWQAAGTADGCLCIGCLEKRLGRTLVPKDFMRRDPFRHLPCTDRLAARRDGA